MRPTRFWRYLTAGMSNLGQLDLAALTAELADRSASRGEADVQAGIRSLLLWLPVRFGLIASDGGLALAD
jgi:hypothetical protein